MLANAHLTSGQTVAVWVLAGLVCGGAYMLVAVLRGKYKPGMSGAGDFWFSAFLVTLLGGVIVGGLLVSTIF
jgi:hypothetical protein